jgi:hypothetical protein
MEEEFKIEKLKDQYPQFFEGLSDEFLNFISSEEMVSQIATICLENGIEDEERIEKIAYRIILVLLEQISKEDLTQVLVNGANLDFQTASRISQRAEELIFSKAPKIKLKEKPVPTKIPKIEKKVETEVQELEKKIERTRPEAIEKPKPVKRDIYREPIE